MFTQGHAIPTPIIQNEVANHFSKSTGLCVLGKCVVTVCSAQMSHVIMVLFLAGMSMGNSSMIGSYGNGPRQLGPMNQFQSQRMPYGMLQGQQSSSTMINSQQFSMLTPQPTQQSVRLAQNPSSNGNSANFNDLKDLLM